MVMISNTLQYMSKDLFIVDFNLERCREKSMFLLISGADQNFEYLENSHSNLPQIIEMLLKQM